MKFLLFMFRPIIVMLFLGACYSPAFSKVVLKERTTHYTVTGSNGEQIYENMLKKGPRVNRKHVLASADIDFKLKNLDVRRGKRHCEVKRIQINLISVS